MVRIHGPSASLQPIAMGSGSMVDQWLAAVGEGAVGTSNEELDAAEAALGVDLPADYRAMMRRVNGGEAEFGDSWIRFWPAGELADRNAGYRVKEFAPGLAYFGSNGGGEAYAWDSRPNRTARYVVIPFIS